jgi:putative Mg2+ transporter-C (MgtC) family protein
VANLSYQLADEGKVFEYQMTIRADNRDSYRRLAEAFTGREQVLEFHIYPTGD